jgi:ribosomal protein S27AE
MMIKSTVKYLCPECGEVAFWSLKDYAEKGEPVCPYDGNDMAREDDFCPHCEILLKSKMFDIDGTNLEEHSVCPQCGFGMPALK